MAGKAASEERELKATAYAGALARAKTSRGTRPPITAAGYNTSSTKTVDSPTVPKLKLLADNVRFVDNPYNHLQQDMHPFMSQHH